MKKFYTTILTIFVFTAMVSAQITIFSTDFTTTDYTTGAPQTNLDSHADWKAGHFANATTWVAFTTANPKDVIRTQSHFAYAIVDNAAIIAANGDIITITVSVDLGFDGQTYGSEPDENLCFLGLLNQNAPATGGDANVRDGVMILNKSTTSELAITNNNQGSGSPFNASSGILTNELNARTYEVIIEYTVGADAASTTKKARITSLNGANGASTTDVSTAMNPAVYTALTGSGAYFMDWALAFGKGTSDINTMQMNSILITKNTPLLSINDRNAFEFSMFPNPVKDKLYFNTREVISKVEAFDLQGRSVLTVDDVSDYIDVSSLSKAVYMLKLNSDNGVSTKKFIKQ